MSISKVGKSHFRIDMNENNLRYLSKTILDILLDRLGAKTNAGELLHYQQIEEHLHLILKNNLHQIQAKMDMACESALNHPPVKTNRENLFGRALTEKIIVYSQTSEEWLSWFKINFLRKFLIQVRISMGIQKFDYFNELLDLALQNECMIRDLEKARIDWSAFFSHRRLTLMLNKARQLRHWVCTLDNQELFLKAVNSEKKKDVRPFQSKDLWHILDAWECDEDEDGI